MHCWSCLAGSEYPGSGSQNSRDPSQIDTLCTTMSVTYLTTPIEETRQDPPPRGSGMTREGYTKRSGAPTDLMIRLQGEKKWRRLMIWQFSNLGTLFVRVNGKPHVVREEMIPTQGRSSTAHATRKSSDDPELDKLHTTYLRLLNKGIALEDAGRTDPKIDAAIDRARAKLQAARRGEPTHKSAAQLECEIAKTLAEAYTKRTGNALEVRKQPKGEYDRALGWFVYHWIPGNHPDLHGPFRNEITACKKMAEIAAG